MPRTVYYITYIDPETGFIKREDYLSHREQEDRARQLRQTGIRHIVEGRFEQP